ncbi:hypothetical protein NKR23_g12289 [Pleurostoma richardsiae]|jgi:hypothetical protein|uniref:Uncharacterized protein n=1 Tax=Pleurostoma richardsiae TaxID=41990 RepID=A0AA38R216_9PEZI|nr:hypothetical protein NKR23_g12289 [Pleurostoma richardsiae]
MVDFFTRVWAKELPPKYGCTVSAVSPGPTATEGFLSAGEEAMKVLQPTIDATPAGKRLGESEEVAFAVAFLCEERAGWVNGQHLFVNGSGMWPGRKPWPFPEILLPASACFRVDRRRATQLLFPPSAPTAHIRRQPVGG